MGTLFALRVAHAELGLRLQGKFGDNGESTFFKRGLSSIDSAPECLEDMDSTRGRRDNF